MYRQTAEEMMRFIEQSPSCYHVICNIKKQLEENGYRELSETMVWELNPGGKYYVTRNGSSLLAFEIPEKEAQSFQIAAAHSDSPTFKLKENAELVTDGHYVELNVEKYGGMLYAPWFDRPLSIAGRAIVETDGVLHIRLVDFGRDMVLIPNLAIHMDKKLNEGYTYNAQKDLLPVFGEGADTGKLKAQLAELLRVQEQQILATDLYLYNRVKGTVWGAEEEFISSARLDDLQCAYACLQGFLQGKPKQSINVLCVFDNEEVGSCTKQGADSTLLRDILERIGDSLGRSRQQQKAMLAGSFMVSADNAHAVHPNHPDKADPTNRPYMNRGIVIKCNANQRYTTDAVSAAVFRKLCERASVPVQSYCNRSDVPGGSTLGNLSNRHVSLDTVDIGLAQLAMHSPYETAGIRDTAYLIQAMREFYSTGIQKRAADEYVLI